MTEYHIDVLTIVNTWSRELLNLMTKAMGERYRRQSEAYDHPARTARSNQISDGELFARMGIQVNQTTLS